jgi:hypothetical protein
MRNDGHFGQLKIFSKKVTYIWIERVTFHDVPCLFWKNSSDTNRKNEFLKKFIFFNFKQVLKLNFAGPYRVSWTKPIAYRFLLLGNFSLENIHKRNINFTVIRTAGLSSIYKELL